MAFVDVVADRLTDQVIGDGVARQSAFVQQRPALAQVVRGFKRAREGSPPLSRTLTRRPIEALRSVHVEAKEVQCGVQAWCG